MVKSHSAALLLSSVLLLQLLHLVSGHLGDVFETCVKGGRHQDDCIGELFDNLRPIMATGLPIINLPVMEPMSLEEIKFHLQDGLIDVTVTFSNLTIVGLSTFETTLAKKVGRDVVQLGLNIPEMEASGNYVLEGNFAFVDLGRSAGRSRAKFFNNTVSGSLNLGKVENTNKITVLDTLIRIATEKIKIRIDCLFPKTGRASCDQCRCNGCHCPVPRYSSLKSGNPTLASTVLRFINEDSGKFVETFQPEIAAQMEALVQKYFGAVLSTIDAAYFLVTP